MEQGDLDLIEKLIVENDELAELWTKHRELEIKLDELGNRVYLSAEEQMERKRLQKIKLAGRDRIELILAEYRQS